MSLLTEQLSVSLRWMIIGYNDCETLISMRLHITQNEMFNKKENTQKSVWT